MSPQLDWAKSLADCIEEFVAGTGGGDKSSQLAKSDRKLDDDVGFVPSVPERGRFIRSHRSKR